jgi:hypothetical protein
MTEACSVRRRRRKRRTYKLDEFKLIGFAAENTPAEAEMGRVLTQATILSDHPFFHHCLRSFAQDVDAKLRSQKADAHLAQASNFAILVDPDFTATLFIDCVDLSLEVVAKRSVEKGEAVWSNDIGDIYRGHLNYPKIRPDQHFILCLRHNWKFLLIFDLTPEQPINLEALENTLGIGMRRLMFESLYQAMTDERVLTAMFDKHWFPFNELIGAEFDDLHQAISNNFNIEAVEATLVKAFDPSRLSRLLDRWWHNPLYEARRELLTEGVRLFSEDRFIPAIKTLMTEIEGILRDRHVPRSSGRQGMDKVLSVAFEDVPKIAGADTIYFPAQFAEYLNASIYGPFDPSQPGSNATRNTVGHGRAPRSAYTSVRALQTILILDQIHLYMTLPIPLKKRRHQLKIT